MVGPGPTAAAAVEERQRKLQEYLAAKGKLKSQNTKPYLKSKNNCLNPPPSKSTIKPKNDVTNHVVLPVKPKRSTSIKLQPRPPNTTGSQKPKLEPPKLLGKRLTSEYASSNPYSKPSSKSFQQREAGSSTTGELSRKPVGSLSMEQLKTTKQQLTNQGNAKCTDSVNNTYVENESLVNFLKETNKENLPHILTEPERKPDPNLCTTSKPKTNSSNQTKNSLVPQQALGKSSVNSAVLKDRVNKQFVGETQSGTFPVKSQQLSRGANLARPGVKPSRTVPSRFIQTLSTVQSSKKLVVKNIKDVKVNRSKYERPNETKLQSYPVIEQRMKHTKPTTYPNLLQGEYNNRHPDIKQDRKSTQPCCIPQTSCILQKPKAISQRPNLTVGRFDSAIPSTPSIRPNGTSCNKRNNNDFQQKARTLKKAVVPQNHFLNKTAPKKADVTTVNETQTNPNIKKKATAEDRRKQLEEWQKSKGKIYKRPPMEIKTKRKVIKEMNISFWKSIEKEEEEKKAQLELSSKINNTLTECLNLIEGGVPSNEILNILSSIPEAEKFAKFWICKAKLLASKGTFDVIGLYEEAIKNGATPIQELREVVLNILQDSNRTTEGITSDSLVTETNITSVEELAKKMESVKSCLSPKEREQVTATPQIAKAEQHNYPGIKLQIGPIPRINGMPEVQDMKLITPVRRSSRIERAVSRYPEMLQEHDLVVASLDELLEMEETKCFIFRRNEALPVTLGFQTPES
ncbi:PREDICTED: cytoskeleton-associated protein 2-like isoform X1 [Mandrillus leucophaeus]|uniref:cytoskeleton-associated protein 2-like isoform X1 n=2 Tax=Mandrillus leucophaeus TaxID=9568 RepID=UPI0005F53BC4|nr:PREDICTED: cytoskeleton-associated protein 2-like isoform X1 [Mandrillus leucophaeus]